MYLIDYNLNSDRGPTSSFPKNHSPDGKEQHLGNEIKDLSKVVMRENNKRVLVSGLMWGWRGYQSD
ncbi:hypothetical protein M413DRAFT_439143 [Hebeloma cylindrosporum]|uniref:Uncharacterized protein n=1 Tax=Hebeloma cylindrosporum TaxID=76867 RepID=A0A0C2YC91_HEBCY|nr:hypothetical protein M413DRAFT_439143 [Hebeloma cylindrosporum h7]